MVQQLRGVVHHRSETVELNFTEFEFNAFHWFILNEMLQNVGYGASSSVASSIIHALSLSVFLPGVNGTDPNTFCRALLLQMSMKRPVRLTGR